MDKWLEDLRKKYDTSWKGGGLKHRKEMFALAKKVASQTGLSKKLTEDLLLTIAGESGFNAKCVNWDSKDYGLCQFSFKYYCKEYKMTPQECIEQPERQLRIMCTNFKNGRQSNWVAYANRIQHMNQLLQLEVEEPPIILPPKPPTLEETRKNIENAKSIVPEVTIENQPTIEIETGILYPLIIAVLNFFKKLYNGKG